MGQVASGWQVVIVCPPGCCFQLLPTACMCLWLPRCFVCLTVCPLKLACGASIFSFKHQQRPAAFTADVRTDNAVIRPGGELMSGHGDRKDKHTRLRELAFYGAVCALACHGRKRLAQVNPSDMWTPSQPAQATLK